MKELPITDAERRVMESLWREAPLSSAEIIERVARNEDWAPKTVQTLIGRLVQKNMLSRASAGRGYLYRPAVSRADFVAQRSRSLIERLFNGKIAPMVAAFAAQGDIPDDDLVALRKLVDELEQKHAAGGCDDGDD